jgi:glycosyltransferase involved in cell wall biosynthesis
MNVRESTTSPRVALVSIGIGRVQRGFERWAQDLFDVLGGRLDLTIYKSAGRQSQRQKVPRCLELLTTLARQFPLGSTEYHRDCVAFGVGMLPDLMQNRFDVLHCVDPPLAVVFAWFRTFMRFRARILFTDGAVIPPEHYPRVDHMHYVSKVSHKRAIDMGQPPSRMTLIPCGIHSGRFTPTQSRQAIRKRHGVHRSAFVILVISARKREHKRVDYIIEEVSRLEGNILLWIDGNPEDPTVEELARARLGDRCRLSYFPSGRVCELYQMADVFVHASLEESFGLAVIEASSSGLPVLVHDSPHFEWLLNERECLLDMSVPGTLSKRLREMLPLKDRLTARSAARAADIQRRFDWSSLAPDYIEMYCNVAALAYRGSVNHR